MLEASIANFETQLIRFLEQEDWAGVDRASDRLKSLLLTALIEGDAATIARITSILEGAGERVELRHRLRLHGCDATGAAWKLRSDTGTGILAARLRPPPPAVADEKTYRDLADGIVAVLRGANTPMNNKQIAQRLERDEPTISRALKRLVAVGRVRQWKSGSRMFNALVESRRYEPIKAIRVYRDAVGKTHQGELTGKFNNAYNQAVSLFGTASESVDDAGGGNTFVFDKMFVGPRSKEEPSPIPPEFQTVGHNFEQMKKHAHIS